MNKINVEYMRRVNLGSYEHSELKVSIAINEEDDINFEIESLKSLVHKHLGIIEEDKNQLPLPIEKAKKPVEKTVAAVEKPKEEVAVNNELKDEVKAEEKEKKTEAKAKKSAPETKPVKKISKATVYDRALDTHKNLLGSFLDKKYPKWRTSDSLKKAAEASKALNGTDFLDENGEILDSFKLAFSNYMDA
jgi:type IV secretory pathway VirB10-like protein